jgi:hypothetical protein
MTFTRGLNPIFMDVTPPLMTQYQLPQAAEIRVALGDTVEYAQRIDLKHMSPREDVCSTTFCLANPGQEYLIYLPSASCSTPPQCMLTIDLSDVDTPMTAEWFSPDTRERKTDGRTFGRAVQTFISPFTGASVLYLSKNQYPRDRLLSR